MSAKLDRKTRKRIEREEQLRAEEAYREQVRQQMATTPESSPPDAPQGRTGCGKNVWYGLLFFLIAGMALQIGNGGNSTDSAPSREEQLRSQPGYVSAAQEGDAWPFTFSEGVLECRRGSAVVITAVPDGNTYALNGTASSMADQEGWIDLETSGVWRDSPEPYIPKVNIGDMISRGLALCE